MAAVKPTREIIEEALCRPFNIEDRHEIIDAIYKAFTDNHRKKLRPLIMLTDAIAKLVPDFLLNILAGHEQKKGISHELDHSELQKRHGQHIGRHESHLHRREFLLELTRNELECEQQGQLDLLNDKELLDLYNEAVLYNIAMDLQLDFIYMRLAGASRHLPNFLIAQLARLALTPFLCARITAFLEPEEAGELARHFSDDFLAEISLFLDPEDVVPITRYIRHRSLQAVVKHLISKEHFRNLGEICDLLDEELALSLAGDLNQAVAISHIFSYMENLDRMKAIYLNYPPNLQNAVYKELHHFDPDKAGKLK